HHGRLVALGRQETVVHRHPVDAARSPGVLVDPRQGIVSFRLAAGLLAGRPLPRPHLIDGGDPGLDAAPFLGDRRAEAPEEQRAHRDPDEGRPRHAPEPSTAHQKPIAAPSPRGSAPPRSVPSVSVMPCAWPMRMKKSETGVTLWPMRSSAARVASGTRLSMRTWSSTSPGSIGPATKRGRSIASWISMP